MKNRNRNRRIYYIPGIISVIFIPILCIIYLKNNAKYKEERVIEINLPSKYNPFKNGRNSIVFDTTVLSRPENIRIYREIRMTNDFEVNKGKITEFRQSVEKLVFTKDTINGVLLTLNATSTYDDLIKLLDICNSSTIISRYILYQDNLWYLYKNDDSTSVNRIRSYNEGILKEQKEIQKEKTNARYLELNQETIIQRLEYLLKIWPWIISYLAFGFISIRYMIKKYCI